MVTIKCTQYEKSRLLKILQRAKESLLKEYARGKITKKMFNYDIEVIKELIDRVNGKYNDEEYLLNSWKNNDSQSVTNNKKNLEE